MGKESTFALDVQGDMKRGFQIGFVDDNMTRVVNMLSRDARADYQILGGTRVNINWNGRIDDVMKISFFMRRLRTLIRRYFTNAIFHINVCLRESGQGENA